MEQTFSSKDQENITSGLCSQIPETQNLLNIVSYVPAGSTNILYSSSSVGPVPHECLSGVDAFQLDGKKNLFRNKANSTTEHQNTLEVVASVRKISAEESSGSRVRYHRSHTSTDVSSTDWGAHTNQLHFHRKVTTRVQTSVIKLQGTLCDLESSYIHTEELLRGCRVPIHSENTTAVAFIRLQGGTRQYHTGPSLKNLPFGYKGLFCPFTAVHLKGEPNQKADFLSHKTLDSREVAITEGGPVHCRVHLPQGKITK